MLTSLELFHKYHSNSNVVHFYIDNNNENICDIIVIYMLINMVIKP